MADPFAPLGEVAKIKQRNARDPTVRVEGDGFKNQVLDIGAKPIFRDEGQAAGLLDLAQPVELDGQVGRRRLGLHHRRQREESEERDHAHRIGPNEKGLTEGRLTIRHLR
ncbi:hypothetical protein JANAI62_36600 [Jannaschia pagri]|uniref:Uncharacterized protein n=1 Tax=Jannaschia pagri TaxID=2829797 RepID=A0ABQ4NRM6_9RHOB|nr:MULTISPECIES: hypothetical protein [unclassified Jannaschia]GIT93196.1 hypothetical protein JANAI61_36540 [Jannaschia sp. AI_61]GIT97037.1 hypothetical protein JANAI62_36600 [Jannaschia sp. AI_62]